MSRMEESLLPGEYHKRGYKCKLFLIGIVEFILGLIVVVFHTTVASSSENVENIVRRTLSFYGVRQELWVGLSMSFVGIIAQITTCWPEHLLFCFHVTILVFSVMVAIAVTVGTIFTAIVAAALQSGTYIIVIIFVAVGLILSVLQSVICFKVVILLKNVDIERSNPVANASTDTQVNRLAEIQTISSSHDRTTADDTTAEPPPAYWSLYTPDN